MVSNSADVSHVICNFEVEDLKACVCTVCGDVFNKISSRESHMQMHISKMHPKSSDCIERFSVEGIKEAHHRLKEHTITEMGEEPHVCADCGKGFPQLGDLKTHMMIHMGAKPHADCFEVSVTGHLNKHISAHTNAETHVVSKIEVSNIKPCICSICGDLFDALSILESHMMTHIGDSTVPSADSFEGFSEEGIKEAHLQLKKQAMLGEGIHECDDCGKRFHKLGALKLHIRTHTGEKPHACNDCGKGFSQAGDLKIHMRTHTGEKPHACSDCGKRFTTSSDLNKHIRSHTGETPYVCSDCGKGFRVSGGLRKHMLTHTGEKPHVCSECGKGFGRSDKLRSHMLTHKTATKCLLLLL